MAGKAFRVLFASCRESDNRQMDERGESMTQFKELRKEFEDAKYRVKLAGKHLQQTLELMVKADLAKVVPDQDGSWEIYIVGPKNILNDIQSMEFEGEDFRFMGVDEGARLPGR